jgi:hypothetical protein
MKTKKAYLMILMSALSILNAYSQIPSYVPSNGLIGYWPFNGNANDETVNGNNGTVNGATLTTDRNGVANRAYSFNDIDNYITILASNTLSFGNQFSISIWFNRNVSSNNDRIFSFEKAHSPDGYQFRFAIDVNTIDNNKLYYIGASNNVNNSTGWSNNNGYTIKTNNTISNSNWNNIVLTRNNSNFTLFLNGAAQSNSQTSQLIDFLLNNNNITLGAVLSNNTYVDFFNGKIDDLAIFNRALSDQEVKQLYTGCNDETATTNSLNGIVLKNAQPINLTASPSLDGQFSGDAITNNQFTPANAHLGKNTIHYNFTNSTGCKDSTDFSVIVADTNTCSTYDTLKIKVKFTAGLYANTINTIKFYPNPTKDVLFIDNGNYQAMSGYSIKIVSLAGTVIYNQPITSQQVQISMNQFATKGLYIAQIVDSNNAIVDSKKIVLE